MKFQDIGRAIVKRSWIVIALLLISLLVAAIFTQTQDPIYKVEIAVSAMAPNNPTTKLPDATIQASYVVLMRSMANYAEGLDVAEAVSRRLAQEGVDITPEELLGKVSAVPETNSTSIKITVSDVSPTRVADIANTWGEVLALKTLKSEANEYFDENLKALILNGTLVFTNRAVPPSKPTQPKPAVYLGLGAFVGLVLGLTIAVLIEYFDPHFRTPQETEELLGLPVLGILPREKGERALQLLPAFGEGSRTWEAYSELRSGLILTRREETPRSILAVAAIPFEAGPAVAANLAMSIAATGRDTLLVDCDLRAGALSGLMGVAGRPGLSDALAGDGDLKGRALAGKFPNLSLLPSGSRRENSTDLLSLPSFARNLRERVAPLAPDVIVIYEATNDLSGNSFELARDLVALGKRLAPRLARLDPNKLPTDSLPAPAPQDSDGEAPKPLTGPLPKPPTGPLRPLPSRTHAKRSRPVPPRSTKPSDE
jgi:capsular polysaccharide biosynthesis protein